MTAPDEANRIVSEVLNGSKPKSSGKTYTRSDLGNAERFEDMHGDKVRWCPAAKKWLYWDGERWSWDERGEVVKRAHETARSIYKDAATEPDPHRQKAIAKFALATQNESRINAMMSQAKPYLFVGMDELDTDEWLLNCENGTLDLRTGKLRDHAPADLITRMVPTVYDPGAEAPRFERFLKEALVDDAVIAFVRRYAGYTATGSTRERMLAILFGSGKNGKTTLVELLQDTLGDYATTTDVETLLIKKNQGVGNDVAALKGSRFVAAAEVEKGRRLAEGKVKQLTGRDRVSARFLFGEFFEFIPEFKLWLSTNNKPVIQGTDDAIWDRLRLIPFNVRFKDGADPNLADQLRRELPGVLAWMVEGCLEWQKHGLREPDEVADATRRYREEMDTLAAFIEERCIVHEVAMAPATPLYAQYRMWSETAGERPETQKMFGMRLRERGFENKQATSGPNKGKKIWLGIGIKVDDPDPDAAKTKAGNGVDEVDDSDDRLPDNPLVDDRLPPGDAGFTGKTPVFEGTVDEVDLKTAKSLSKNLAYEKNVETRSTSSTSSTVGGGPSNSSDYGKLSEDVIAAEMRRSHSGAAKALVTYLDKPNEARLKYLTNAVLRGLGKDAGDCERHAGAVKAAATDPANHSPGCVCGECS